MEKFAKLFEDEKYGQIVVLLDTDDEGDPCLKFMTQPPGLGVCVAAMTFHSDTAAREVFERVDLAGAVAAAKDMWVFSPESEAA